MTEFIEKPKRPTSITIICIIGFIGALISIPLLFSPITSQIGSWYPPFMALSVVIGLASMTGMWLMKKWGAYLYTGMTVVNQVILLLTGLWTIMALIIPAVVVFFALRAVSKMN